MQWESSCVVGRDKQEKLAQLSLTHTHIHTNTPAHTHAHTPTVGPTLSLTHTHIHTNTLAHTHAHTNTPTHTGITQQEAEKRKPFKVLRPLGAGPPLPPRSVPCYIPIRLCICMRTYIISFFINLSLFLYMSLFHHGAPFFLCPYVCINP